MIDAYFNSLETEGKRVYEIAQEARKKGLDPSPSVEIPLAADMAGRIEGIVGPKGVAKKIKELDMQGYSREKIAITIADEIIAEKYSKKNSKEKLAEQAVRTGLAILTEGIVSAPLEGISDVKIKTNFDGTDYLALYFAGPIRSAGGTAAALSVLLGDYVRKRLGLSKYKATEEEIQRFIEEIELYERGKTNLQYKPSNKEVIVALTNIPIEITGESTEEIEVSGYRNLERIETNKVRGGALLALAEGVIQKSKKIEKVLKVFELEGWEFLKDMKKEEKKDSEDSTEKVKANWKYLSDLLAGRPVIAHPSTKGGFRLRYGRSRNTGFAAWGYHPGAMKVVNEFIAVGTQLKTERPGKATVSMPVDSILPPFVKFKDQSCDWLYSYENIKNEDVEEVIFLGDVLIAYGDFVENNHLLLPSGYVEEWWTLELEKALKEKEELDEYKDFLENKRIPEVKEAIELSKKYEIPLHPKYNLFWNYITIEDLDYLVTYQGFDINDTTIIFNLDEGTRIKKIIENLCLPHQVSEGKVKIDSYIMKLILSGKQTYGDTVLDRVSNLLGVKIRDAIPTTVGCRMGRPEKAKERKMSPPVHVLFPIGMSGGSTRSVIKASQKNFVEVESVNKRCPKCNAKTHLTKCPDCESMTKLYMSCSHQTCSYEGSNIVSEKCPECGSPLRVYSKKKVNLKDDLSLALLNLGCDLPKEVKGVQGMSSEYKIPEPIEKGILRASNEIYVFKDGTCRYDATDAPLTHFIPKEANVSIEKLKQLGYVKDYLGNELTDETQIIELNVQDIIVPKDSISYLFRVSKFLDDELEKIYGMQPYYKLEKEEDLIGQLVVGLAPHTSAGTIGRIVGFTNTKVVYAHPYFHAAKRRNCDGDEDSIMLLMDALLNFSKYYLPQKRGGQMDAPLVLTTRIDPREVDKEVHNMDISEKYSLEFYEATLKYLHPKEIKIERVENRLGTSGVYSGLKFTHHTSDISKGPKASSYTTLNSMEDKLMSQFEVAKKIRAVDENDVAERVLKTHFIPDIKGNIRSYAKQKVRCTKCNTTYRRVPLSGKCAKCSNKLVLTVTKGAILKYMKLSIDISEKYKIKEYTSQEIILADSEVKMNFREKHRQLSVSDFC
ncbi:MAG: DNA polymerase II large subunit [Candidatus Methanofastidiosum methylothiophilum]|uniref:DNA polymerase II large subunit n=1 Tax=Candidatus Methanofastidiosum methylothiophilum TaxID=1705564 RepID=A0A150IQA5_9EURY|nr:MAG: DNA polymerase II large subunit [Candidatus Methanofastidiosum methylthiophilus]KYC47231.1 MAG: DNA polymerase II large subunit [Candidatus Methanofastidiosum methylthiophilus]KYC49702.1 MAG: DNA polymerase II large subunit [Candidatus Methanofastidiosum methylthiophilus]